MILSVQSGFDAAARKLTEIARAIEAVQVC
jgi:hypothetical protein